LPNFGEEAVITFSGTLEVASAVIFTVEDCFCDNQTHSIQEYEWVLPAEAYDVSGQGTSSITCRFAPSGTYDIELKARCQGGWNVNPITKTVLIQSPSSPWLVKPDGSDDNDGQPTWSDAFNTLQKAIDVASNGDYIYVASGSTGSPNIYYENIDFKGKNLIIRSISTSVTDPDPETDFPTWEDAENTIIDGTQQGTTVIYRGNEMLGCQIEGFTITGGAPAGDGLALKLDFDNSLEPFADSSGRQRNGTNSGATWGEYDGYNSTGGLELTGDDYVEIQGYKGVVNRGARTCAAWIKIDETFLDAGTILCWGESDTERNWSVRLRSYWADLTSSKLELGIWGGVVRGSTELNDGIWHHVAVALEDDGDVTLDDVQLYVDGVRETEIFYNYSGNIPEINTTANADVLVGAQWASDGQITNFFEGLIDDVHIYSRALRTDEIAILAGETPSMDLGPIAHWKLDGDCDDAAADHDGVAEGTPVYSEGLVGQALQFDGDDYVEISHVGDLSSLTSLVMAAWVFPVSGIANYDIIVNKENEYEMAWKDNQLVSAIKTNTNNWFWTQGTGANTLPSGRWTHVAVVWDGSKIYEYINGVLKKTTVQSGNTTSTTTNPLMIGRRSSGAYWDGKIDDVRIYNYGLSVAGVKSMYQTVFSDGGGIKGHCASADISKSIIKDNTSKVNGGGISDFNGRIENCIIAGNTTTSNGGGIADSYADIVNCTIADNTASQGGGLYNCDGFIKNTIIWNNSPDQLFDSPYITYSCIQNWTGGGTENISDNPIFVDSENGNYHLDVHSKCIDKGDRTSDYDNELENNGDRINLGAYGNTSEAEIYDSSDSGPDTDADGLKDWMEIYIGTNLNDQDSDDDERLDGQEVTYNSSTGTFTFSSDPLDEDSDSDGMSDAWESQYGLNPTEAAAVNQDSDGDGLTDLEEFWAETDPTDSGGDTDNDGLSDLYEVENGLDPLSNDSASDPDGDGISNSSEYNSGVASTNPYHHNTSAMIIEYVYNSAGRVLQEQIENGQGTVFSVTEYDYDGLGRQVLQQQHQYDGNYNGNPETASNNNTANDIITLTTYDALGDVEWSVQKISRPSGDDEDVVQDGDLVTFNDSGYEDEDSSGDGVLEQVSETKVGHYSSTTGDVVVASVSTNVAYYDRDDGDSDGYYSWTKSIAPAHDGSNTRAVTTSYYDGPGRVYAVVDARDHYSTMTYDSMGQVIKTVAWEEKDPSADIEVMQTRSVYDNLGRVTRKATMADASSSNDPCLLNGDIITDYTYDYDNTVVERDYPGQLVAQKIYYGSTPTAAITYYDYDELGRRNKTTDPAGNTTDLVYNPSGQVVRSMQTDVYSDQTPGLILANDSYYEYDSAGRIASVITKPDDDDLGSPFDLLPLTLPTSWLQTTFDYDAAGRKIREVKPNGVNTTYTYWAAGQKKAEVADADPISGQPDGDTTPNIKQTTEWSYDRVGRLKTIAGYTNEANSSTRQETEYAYNDLGSVTDIYYPDYDDSVSTIKGRIQYAYFANGQVATRTDQRGIETKYTYDATGRNLLTKAVDYDVVSAFDSDIEEAFEYDALGRMTQAVKTDETGASSVEISKSVFAYFDTGMLGSEAQSLFGATAKTVYYAYDTAGFRTSIVYPDTTPTTLTRTNTPLGQIDTLSLDGGTSILVDYAYLGSRVASRTYNTTTPVTANYRYDQYGRISDIDAGSGYIRFTYEYVDKENNIEKMYFHHRGSGVYNAYTYDDIDRLTKATYLDDGDLNLDEAWERFIMDDLGNREIVEIANISQTRTDEDYAVNTLTNRYTDIGGAGVPDPQHDDAGNLREDHRGYSYIYDYENRIIRIFEDNGDDVYTSGTDTNIAEFAYDTQGRRIMVYDAVLDAETRFYYSDNWQVLAEYDDSDVLQRYYVFGNYIDEVLFMKTSVVNYYYLHDHLYSPVALLRKLGGVVLERYEYDAYGKATIWDAGLQNTRTSSSYGNPYTFTGRELDVLDDGDLMPMHYRHREYDTHAGRFMQQDPLGIQPVTDVKINPFVPGKQYSDGMNVYQYLASGPVHRIDPFGLWGSNVHYELTAWWAYQEGYSYNAATAIGAADNGVDGLNRGGTGPVPWGEQSYHFNRNLNGGTDSRIEHWLRHYQEAVRLCCKAIDRPVPAAEQLGTSQHPRQDWVAHADYAMKNKGNIWVVHNSNSPQKTYGDPGSYPDDINLDVVGSPDGRATSNFIVDKLVVLEGDTPYGPIVITYSDFAYYEPGTKRITMTENITRSDLAAFLRYVKEQGGCKCKKYFLREQ
jgi:RHS repeat-associated protein